MKGSKLTKLEDFVLDTIKANDRGLFDFVDQIEALAKLLKSKPKLGHFLPCDDEGKPMEKPEHYDNWTGSTYEGAYNIGVIDNEYCRKCEAYQQALDRVLWEGDWKLIGSYIVTDVEDRPSIAMGVYETYEYLTEMGLIFKREL